MFFVLYYGIHVCLGGVVWRDDDDGFMDGGFSLCMARMEVVLVAAGRQAGWMYG